MFHGISYGWILETRKSRKINLFHETLCCLFKRAHAHFLMAKSGPVILISGTNEDVSGKTLEPGSANTGMEFCLCPLKSYSPWEPSFVPPYPKSLLLLFFFSPFVFLVSEATTSAGGSGTTQEELPQDEGF